MLAPITPTPQCGNADGELHFGFVESHAHLITRNMIGKAEGRILTTIDDKRLANGFGEECKQDFGRRTNGLLDRFALVINELLEELEHWYLHIWCKFFEWNES